MADCAYQWNPEAGAYQCPRCGDLRREPVRRNCRTPPRSENQIPRSSPPAAAPSPSEGCCGEPSLLELACNLAGAAVRSTLHGFRLLDPEAIGRRWSVCQRCPFLDRDASRCTQCGCYLNAQQQYANKAAHPGEECPKGFWPKEKPPA